MITPVEKMLLQNQMLILRYLVMIHSSAARGPRTRLEDDSLKEMTRQSLETAQLIANGGRT